MRNAKLLTTVAVLAFSVACGGAPAASPERYTTESPSVSAVASPVPPLAAASGTGALSWAEAVAAVGPRSVTWSILEGSTCGTVTSSGVYTAPASAATCNVVATSAVDAAKSASAAVTVLPAAGGSTIAGTVTTRTLSLANSPYLVTGDVTVPAGNRLTIEPGVRVIFQGHYKISVAGRMTAVGTAAQRIVFTHKDGSNVQGHNGIRFPASTSLVGGSGDVVEYCIFEYGNKDGLDGAGPDGAYSEVAGGGVYMTARDNFAFNNNEVRFNKASEWGGGMTVIAPASGGTMIGNNFHDNQQTTTSKGYGGGIWFGHVMAANMWTVRGGEFRNNSAMVFGGGIAMYDATMTLDSVAMSGNTVRGVLNNFQIEDASRLTLINTPLP